MCCGTAFVSSPLGWVYGRADEEDEQDYFVCLHRVDIGSQLFRGGSISTLEKCLLLKASQRDFHNHSTNAFIEISNCLAQEFLTLLVEGMEINSLI